MIYLGYLISASYPLQDHETLGGAVVTLGI